MKTLRTYECSLDNFFNDGSALISNHTAKSPSSARYQFWYEHQDSLAEYNKCYNYIRSRSLGPLRPEHYYGDKDRFDKMKKHRGIEFAYQGMVVDVAGEKGWIVGSNSHMNLDVLFEGKTHVSNCHPMWETTYYEKGSVIKDFKQPRKNN